jgi:hypothetical protein
MAEYSVEIGMFEKFISFIFSDLLMASNQRRSYLPWPSKLGLKDGLLVCERVRETEIEKRSW